MNKRLLCLSLSPETATSKLSPSPLATCCPRLQSNPNGANAKTQRQIQLRKFPKGGPQVNHYLLSFNLIEIKKFFVLPIAVALMGAGFCSCSDDDNEEIVEPVEAAKTYAIEAANDLTGGVIAINPTSAKAGATITLTATPADGFAFVEWYVVRADNGEAVAVADTKANPTTLKMPEVNIKVSAKFDLAQASEHGIETVKIPAGTFTMGSPATEAKRINDEVLHEVTISKDFYMSKYEVTNAQFAEFLNAVGVACSETGEGTYDFQPTGYSSVSSRRICFDSRKSPYDGSKFNFGVNYENGKWVPAAGYENHPAVFVSWLGADAYCQWIGGSMPTEAQWEYAARGGQTESLPYGIGDGKNMVQGMAQFLFSAYTEDGVYTEDESISNAQSTIEVGSFEPNGYGLYDMHGNAYEYCLDEYKAYPTDPVTDYVCLDGNGRVILRGGGWLNASSELRSACRFYQRPNVALENNGFRVVFAAE